MPVKARVAKERRSVFSPEAIELFRKLEAVPMRRRRAQWFKDDERRLAKLLGLNAELFCSIVSVLDRESAALHDPERPQYQDFLKVRAVREALLAATGAAVGDTTKQ
jgi:hypothetical protein